MYYYNNDNINNNTNMTKRKLKTNINLPSIKSSTQDRQRSIQSGEWNQIYRSIKLLQKCIN